MEAISTFIHTYLSGIYFPDLKWTDVLDIIIIAYIIYHLLLWVKTSRAWTLVKGVVVVALFLIFAAIVKLNTILWIAKNLINVFLLAIVVLFQPELRRALDEIGRKNIISRFFSSFGSKNNDEKVLSDKTIYELVKTSVQLAKDKTGALIVIEHDTPMGEYIDTGIKLESVVSQQLLINIFEKNTPLHDGAVIVRGNRITAATCYLPLSDNMNIGKELGTRHRAGVGVSEVTDSLTIIVSEETGKISVAYGGVLDRSLDSEKLKDRLRKIQNKTEEEHKHRPVFRGRAKAE